MKMNSFFIPFALVTLVARGQGTLLFDQQSAGEAAIGITATVLADFGTNWVVSTLSIGTNTSFSPYGVAVDSATNLYVADWGNQRILRLTPTGTTTSEIA
jgi:hypothetical protein